MAQSPPVVVLNSVKFTPDLKDVDGVLADAAKLEVMLASLDAVWTEPFLARALLRAVTT